MTTALPRAQSPDRAAARRRRRSWPTLRCIGALILREMSSTYGRSPGGYLWAIFEPVAGIFILTTASAFMMMRPPIGTSFELFYATGMLPFLMFNTVANRVGTAIFFSKPLLVYPAVTFVDALIARFIVNILTEVLVFYIVITTILMLYDTRSVLDVTMIAQGLALTALFGFALGTLNAYLFMKFHTWHVIWSVISRPLFIISGVFFMWEKLPEPLRGYLWYNPIVHCVGLIRAGFYPSYDATYTSPTVVILTSLVMIGFGVFMLARNIKWLIHES